MRFTDSPTATAEIRVAAAPETVWDLVADITLPARFSDEFQGADWVDPTSPTGVGARFLGRNKNPSIGEWEVTCTVIRWDPPAAFAWAVGDLDAPAATWGFDLEPDGDGTRLRQWAQMGPGPSGVTMLIGRDPDAEEMIVAGRLRQWQRNMDATVAGIRALAESSLPPAR